MILARWAIVLAAGQGSRLRLLTTDDRGVVTPKQFCSLRGGASLLEEAIVRAERLVPRDRVLVVVAADHAAFWRGQLAHLPPANVIVQPRDRGTALGLLLPLLVIMARDPEPSLVVLPADHHVRDEATLAASLGKALAAAVAGEAGVILLGVEPEAATSDYGWILPTAGNDKLRRVVLFAEKPALDAARSLLAQGAAWNTFLFAARGRPLLDLVERESAGVTQRLHDALRLGADTLDRVYATLPTLDLSRDVFARRPEALRLLRVPACGWSDLGTPQRVAACLANGALPTSSAEVMHRGVSVNLAARLRGQAATA